MDGVLAQSDGTSALQARSHAHQAFTPGLREELRAKRAYTLVCLELWARCFLDRPRAELTAPTDGPYPLHPAVAETVSD